MAFQPIIYSFGAGDYLNSIFESLSILFDFNKHNEMIWLGRIAGLLGVIWISLSSFASRGRDGSPGALDWSWFLRFAMVWLILIVPKTDLRIEDLTNKKTFVVTNAPWALSIFGWFTSSIGYGFTNLYENVLGGGMNPVESYSGNGIAFGSSYYNSLPKIARFDNNSMETVRPFIAECLIPAVGPINSKFSGITKDQLFTTTNYNAAIDALSTNYLQNRYVYVNGSTYTCLELRDKLKTSFGTSGDRVLKVAGIANWQVVNGLDNAFIKQATDASANSLKQAMMINAIQATAQSMAVQYGDAALADSLTQAQAQYQQVSAWRQGSQFASVSLVWLHIVAESLVYAIWPLLCFLFLLPVGFAIVMEYIKILFWLQTWPILYAILNSVIAVYAKDQSQALAMEYSGFTMSNFYQIGDINGGVVATAGYLSTLVPVLSWMFLQKAGMAVMSAIGGFTGAVNNTAESAGKQEALGNMDINRVSVKNSNTAGESTTGLETQRNITSAGTATTIGDKSYFNQNASNLQVTPSSTSETQARLQNQLTETYSKMTSHTNQIGNLLSSGSSSDKTIAASVDGESTGRDHSVSTDGATGQTYGGEKKVSVGSGLKLSGGSGGGKTPETATTSATNPFETKAQAAVKGFLSTAGSFIKGVGNAVSGNVNQRGDQSSSISDKDSLETKYNDAVKYSDQAASKATNAADAEKWSNMSSELKAWKQDYSHAQSLQDSLTKSQSETFSMQENRSQAYAEFVAGKVGGVNNITDDALRNPAYQAEFSKSYEAGVLAKSGGDFNSGLSTPSAISKQEIQGNIKQEVYSGSHSNPGYGAETASKADGVINEHKKTKLETEVNVNQNQANAAKNQSNWYNDYVPTKKEATPMKQSLRDKFKK